MKAAVVATLVVAGLVPLPSAVARLGPNERELLAIDLPSKNHHKTRRPKAEVATNRIVGGSAAAEGKYPFFVDWGGCGASLIHSDIILTAAHCNVLDSNVVFVGSYREGVGEQHEITKRQRHPQFNDMTLEYDYLLLKINSNSAITPVAINGDASNPTAGENLIIIGHGDTSANGGYNFQDTLMEATVPYIPPSTCNGPSMYGGAINDNVMLCAGYAAGGIDSCQGDSGGPALEFVNGAYVQVGIVSWGYGCAQPNYPGVYSRVSKVKPWIDEQICSLSSDPPPSCSSASATVSTPTPSPPSSTATLPSATLPTSTVPTSTVPTSNVAGPPSTVPSSTVPSSTVPSSTPLPGGQVAVQIDISYDYYPEETGWSITQGNETILNYEPGTFDQFGLVSKTIYLDPGEYTFTMTDSVGDGICCVYGPGRYKIFAMINGVEILLVKSRGEFTSSQTTTLVIPDANNITSIASLTGSTTSHKTAGNCQDSESMFEVDAAIGSQDCSWLADNKDRFSYMCRFVDVAVACPSTCDLCDLF